MVVGGIVAGLVVADRVLPWLADRIWWIGGTLAACVVLSVAACMALAAWTDRRELRFAASRGILSRADVIRSQLVQTEEIPQFRAVVVEPERPAIAPAIHLHFHGLPEAEQAAIIRRALEGK